jgi:hypothetical protein
MAAQEISLRNGVAFFVYFWVLVASWIIVAIRAPLIGDQYLTLLFAGVAANAQLLCDAA